MLHKQMQDFTELVVKNCVELKKKQKIWSGFLSTCGYLSDVFVSKVLNQAEEEEDHFFPTYNLGALILQNLFITEKKSVDS